MSIATVNPATGETLRTFAPHTDAIIEEKLAASQKAYHRLRRRPVAERAALLLRVGELLEAEKEALGRLMTIEMGKPIKAAIAEAEKCAWVCRYYGENAERFLSPEHIETSASESYVLFQPIGPVLAVMPWNFPFWQVFRFAAPALAAGNVGLLKHASNVPQCALAIEDVIHRAGFEQGAFQTLLVGASVVPRLLADDRVAAATLTGSEGAGRSVGAEAGKQIKKTVLELGGSDPFIVLPSADLDAAVTTAVKARIINNGQSCIAAKRFIVHEAIAPEFERRFAEVMGRLKVGDPLDPETEVGPLATAQVRADIEAQVEASVKAGAKLLTGGKRLDRPGYFYAPTALSELPAEAPAVAEETFGPVAALVRVKSLDEAIEVANATHFGLGASAWTRDAGEKARLVAEVEAGAVFVNAMVASDPRVPFGGIKQSGYGRELGVYGIREFVNIKTVWVA
ncbi:NAD-dependent succinate-semialdehyde dehydrogenase [Chondromyces crocatus]|uniref:Succinate-semialdehyde dehydrogenase n=1 Tax=Chondromyces crocatus TaxID=52 RepID=A0A0K1EDG8_CHOCO|nr:NAD-dependent succinate-semialdehyde dehydrogenase [Chondromyces crocatus]AKT38603.1 succinate-semialdehyde dehydrogenase [Chondromyces crocatus]